MKDIFQKWFIENHTDLMMEMTEVFHGYGNGAIDNPWHLEGSIWEHTKMVMNQAQRYFEGDYILMFSALLHDIGKVKTYEDFQDKSGTYKRSFKNHEAVSVFMASDILNSTNLFDLRDFEKEQILKIIGLHGRLYDFIGNPDRIQSTAKMFENDSCTLEYLRKFYICDHSGRITYPELEKSNPEEVNKWFKDVLEFIAMQKYDGTKIIPDKEITVLVGLPRSGKSTYCKTLKDVEVISRDDILMEYA
jgi:putative nucleotidyltransferase with HDIG domain